MTCPDSTNNSEFLEGKPRGSVTLKQIVDAVNSQIQTELIDPACDLETQSSVLTATGVWLDRIGERVSLPRPFVFASDGTWFGFDGNGLGFDQAPFTPNTSQGVPIADEPYRALIIVRGAQLLTDCSIPSMDSTIENAFGSGHYIDYGDMTMDVILDDSLPDEIIKYIADSGLITKPAGVRIRNIFINHTGGSFGFDGNGLGFDQAPFIRTIEDL